MVAAPNKAKNIANALRREIKTAPAGGTFHNAELSEVTDQRVSPDTASFVVIDGAGKAFKISAQAV